MFKNIKNMKINKNNYICTINTFEVTLRINKNNYNKNVLIELCLVYCVLFCFIVYKRQSTVLILVSPFPIQCV